MPFSVVYSKAFNTLLRKLNQQGHRKMVGRAQAAIADAAMNGHITSLERTHHGESRLPNVEKYDLGDGFRLVVQLVDGEKKLRAFLFVGSHDEAQRWLDNHRNYRWVRSNTDGTLEFIQVTERREEQHIPADRIDLDSPEELLALPLLRVLSNEQWRLLGLPSAAADYARSVTGQAFERDAEGVFERFTQLAPWDKACLLLDLLYHAHAREWSELHRRAALAQGTAQVAVPAEVALAMTSGESSESYITFDDAEVIEDAFKNGSLADWMLFLHPEQRKVALRDFTGPARLRGVSGSGKTSVLVHRARYLAKKYRAPILLVTLTESMRRLLDKLLNELCGIERQLIFTMTMSALAKQVVQHLHPKASRFYSLASDEQQERFIGDAIQRVRQHEDFSKTPFHAMSSQELRVFIRDEISFVRSRIRADELTTYLDTKNFQRRGRRLALNEVARRVCLDALLSYEQNLTVAHLLDHEGIVAEALKLVESETHSYRTFRCILADEVQDLSQLEVALLSKLLTPSGERMSSSENGFFLAGDGAQTIYRRGFTLRRLGIDVTSRSYVLRKNYRNTYEILKAAYGLVERYEFADVDEENTTTLSAPEFAKRHGTRPMVIRCASLRDEMDVVASLVHSLVTAGHVPGQICVVGTNQKSRNDVRDALTRLGVANTDLREDVDFESEKVKVSTIESAKGHEFGAVFIMGLVEGVLPNNDVRDEEMAREASRLYVAMTRARENLYLTYNPSASHSASRFLLAIQQDCDEAVFRQGELRRLDAV